MKLVIRVAFDYSTNSRFLANFSLERASGSFLEFTVHGLAKERELLVESVVRLRAHGLAPPSALSFRGRAQQSAQWSVR